MANRAVCYDPESEYAIVRGPGGEHYITALPLLRTSQDLKVPGFHAHFRALILFNPTSVHLRMGMGSLAAIRRLSLRAWK